MNKLINKTLICMFICGLAMSNSTKLYSETTEKKFVIQDIEAPQIIQKYPITIVENGVLNIFEYIDIVDDNKIKVIINDKNVDTTKAGKYYMNIIVSDENNNSIKRDFPVEVITKEEYINRENILREQEKERVIEANKNRLVQQAQERAYEVVENGGTFTSVINEDMYSFAQGYLGMKGWCTDVAKAFLSGYYGEPVNIFGGYEVSAAEAQPGDIAYYRRSSLGTQHYAVYLGGDQALHGNYNGTTVITNVVTQGSTFPQFFRVH